MLKEQGTRIKVRNEDYGVPDFRLSDKKQMQKEQGTRIKVRNADHRVPDFRFSDKKTDAKGARNKDQSA